MTDLFHRMVASRLRPVVTPLAAGLVAILVSGCGTPFKVQEQFTLKAPAQSERLIVENTIGDVTIQSDAQATEVSAVITKIGRGATAQEAERALAELEVSLAVDDAEGALRAKVSHPRPTTTRQHAVEWKITAPPSTAIRVTTTIGDATVTGFRKDITIKSDIGDARVCCDPVEAGAVAVATGVGDIHVTGCTHGLTAKSDVGDIHATAGGAVDLDSSVGDVVLTLKATTAERVRIGSDVGDVCLNLCNQQQGKLSATTGVGSVRLSLYDMTMREFRHREHQAVAQLGESATPAIDITTGVGDVTVRSYTTEAPGAPTDATMGAFP